MKAKRKSKATEQPSFMEPFNFDWSNGVDAIAIVVGACFFGQPTAIVVFVARYPRQRIGHAKQLAHRIIAEREYGRGQRAHTVGIG